MDAITIFFLMGLLMFLLGMGGFMLYVLFGTWNPERFFAKRDGPRSSRKRSELIFHLDLSCKNPTTNFRLDIFG